MRARGDGEERQSGSGVEQQLRAVGICQKLAGKNEINFRLLASQRKSLESATEYGMRGCGGMSGVGCPVSARQIEQEGAEVAGENDLGALCFLLLNALIVNRPIVDLTSCAEQDFCARALI